jgi:hypothetical protein
VDVHFCLFELHTELLGRSFVEVANQQAKHDLFLADDMINALGDGDLAVGDSLTLFFQSDRPDKAGFFFDVGYSKDNAITKSLSAITTQRDTAIDAHIENDLNPSDPLADEPKFTDIPFVQSLANDKIYMNTADNVGVGDFAMIGLVTSAQDVEVAKVQTALADYFDSIKALRTPPSVASANAQLKDVLGSKIEFYSERYGNQVEGTEPVTHGDTFVGESSANAVFGEFLTGFAFTTAQGIGFGIDIKANAYSTYQNAEFNTALAGDTFNLVDGTKVDGQYMNGKDTTVGQRRTARKYDRDATTATATNTTTYTTTNTTTDTATDTATNTTTDTTTNTTTDTTTDTTNDNKMDDVILAVLKVLFVDHPLFVQMANDFYNEGIQQSTLTKLKGGVCYDEGFVSFIPEAPEFLDLFQTADADSQ